MVHDFQMKATIKTYQSGSGDCIFFLLRDGERKYNIMIDCGEYTPTIKVFVEETLAKQIDLLIVTHIDEDHILGVEQMMTDTHNLNIGKIIFNSYERPQGQLETPLTDIQKKRIASIQSELNCVFRDALENQVSATQAIKGLSKTILERQALRDKWERGYTALDARKEIDLKEWGTIKILAPTMKELRGLDEKFRSVLFSELFVEDDNVVLSDCESLYEMLIRYAELHDKEPAEDLPTSSETLEERLKKAAEENPRESSITPANKASLAFVWEKNGKKVLILGDAKPSIVVKGLLNHYPQGPYPMFFEAIKVAHHGSHYNTTEALMNMIDSEHYFLTGGEEGVRPSEAAVGLILFAGLKSNVTKRTLHVNYKTNLVEQLAEDQDLQERYHFDVDFDLNQHEFTL